MEPRRDCGVSRHRSADLPSRQSTATIFSLNEAWLHILDEYVIDTPLSQIILPMMRGCFFGGAIYAVLLLQKGHGDRVAADIAGFIAEKPES
jgi:hypothetical protein